MRKLLLLTLAIVGVVALAGTSSAFAATIFSEGFGTGSTIDDISISNGASYNWDEPGNDTSDDNTSAITPGSGNDSISPNGGRFAKISEDEWICITLSSTGYENLMLSYDWRGDEDSESGGPGDDDGIVEYRTSSGSCSSAGGWTLLQNEDVSIDSLWSTQSAFALPVALDNNSSFRIRFRADSSESNEYFRVDGINITGDPISVPENTLALCTDGLDNDGDGAIDRTGPAGVNNDSDCSVFSPSITINEVIVNDNSGVATDIDTGLSGTAQAGDVIGPFGYVGHPSIGPVSIFPGSYAITAVAIPGYNITFGGACDAGGNFAAVAADPANVYVCTVTADDVPPITECSDGVDNADAEDVLVDLADPGCTDASDNDETDPAAPISITSLTLLTVDGSDIGTDVEVIDNGDVFNYDTLGTTNLTIRADASPAVVGSVKLELTVGPNSPYSKTENAVPYSLYGNPDPSTYASISPILGIGEHTLVATPYTAANLGGSSGSAITRTFKIIQNEGSRCADGIDNDLDGNIDMADSDCVPPTPENDLATCSNGVDDNGNGFIDLLDSDCAHLKPIVRVTKTIVADNVNGINWAHAIGDFALSLNLPTLGTINLTSGVDAVVDEIGTVSVVETGGAGYQMTFGGACDASGNISLAVGQTYYCTLENNDLPQCSNGLDDDGDGRTDDSDGACSGAADDDEGNDIFPGGGQTTGSVLGASTEGSTEEGSGDGKVAGAIAVCELYLPEYIKDGNDPKTQYLISKLQVFLNEWESAGLKETGVYDEATIEAVKKFQLKYADEILTPWGLLEPTGWTYITTTNVINRLIDSDCAAGQVLPELIPFAG